jgi:SnoaL-like domain
MRDGEIDRAHDIFWEECVSVGHASTLSVSIPHAGWDWRGAAARDTGVRCHRGRTLALARNALRLPMGRDIAGKIFIADWASALHAKDLDRLLSHYAADVTVFDVKPLFQTTGAAAWRATWEACLSYFPSSFQMEARDVRIIASGDVALAH